MDSLTHIVLGACMGEALAGKQLGRKAMLWGAVAQSLPDIDFVASFWMDTPDYLLAHRGFTHSFLFCLLMIPLFAWAAEKIHGRNNYPFRKGLFFFGISITVHVLLDAFNNYGVGWFEPFSHARISFHTVYVADPFFTLFPLMASLLLVVRRKKDRWRKYLWMAGLGCSLFYLLYCVVNKLRTDQAIRAAFVAQQIPHAHYFSTPTPLQSWLWFVVAGNDSGYNVGYYSVFDRKKKIDFVFYKRNDHLLHTPGQDAAVPKLVRFSQGFYTIEQWRDTLVFNDLRFGQIRGWESRPGHFVFHYYLNQPGANKLVVQRGRAGGWSRESWKGFVRRILGNRDAD